MLSLWVNSTVIYVMDNLERKYRGEIQNDPKAELDRLKTQLNPHFIFNTLTSIYALIDFDRDQARRAVRQLSHLLRYVVYDIPEATLERDLQFTRNYISLMKLRLRPGDVLDVHIGCGDCGDLPIAPMLFVTIIENAFKHGRFTDSSNPISISITARDGHVNCHTVNPYTPDQSSDAPHGVGLFNLRRRLQLLYGDSAILTTEGDGRLFVCDLNINLNQK